jgi:membrane peptidoglycan carboxypeptidase
MARAYATFAQRRNRIDGSILGNVPRAITTGRQATMTTPRAARVLSPTKTAILNSILQKVVTEGTGHSARAPDRPVAGKTGTTENYGDAWFVGYVPQLVVAVWVGYPRELKPMMTEYHGDPVAGGTFPAEIWQHVHGEGAAVPHDDPSRSRPRTSRTGHRGGRLPGRALQSTTELPFAAERALLRRPGAEPTANCKPNEVEVPDVVGQSVSAATARLTGSRCRLDQYQDRQAGEKLNVVLAQKPEKGRLSAYDHVTLIVAKATHGVVPSCRLPSTAQAKVRAPRARGRHRGDGEGPPGRVVFQLPRAGVAAAPGCTSGSPWRGALAAPLGRSFAGVRRN